MDVITDKEVALFKNTGYLSFPKLLSDELDSLKSYCEDLMSRRGFKSEDLYKGGEPLVWIRCNSEERIEFGRRTGVYKKAIQWASKLLELPEDCVRLKLRIFFKRPKSHSHVPWHQDEAFYQAYSKEIPDGYRSLNFWISLNNADRDAGTLKYIPESHKSGLLDHKILEDEYVEGLLEGESRDNDEQTGTTLYTDKVDERRQVYAEVREGGVNIHHCRTLHGSDNNESDSPRAAFVLIVQEKDDDEDVVSEHEQAFACAG